MTPDIIAPGLQVLFVGINPGLMSAATGHNFARPGNRFWPTLHRAGFTPRQLRPAEQQELLDYGLGITNFAARPTRAASELTTAELREGARALERLVARFRPEVVAFVGITAYRIAFERPQAQMGPQPHALGGSAVWVLPNPSGLNAHHTPDDLARLYAELRAALDASPAGGPRPDGVR